MYRFDWGSSSVCDIAWLEQSYSFMGHIDEIHNHFYSNAVDSLAHTESPFCQYAISNTDSTQKAPFGYVIIANDSATKLTVNSQSQKYHVCIFNARAWFHWKIKFANNVLFSVNFATQLAGIGENSVFLLSLEKSSGRSLSMSLFRFNSLAMLKWHILNEVISMFVRGVVLTWQLIQWRIQIGLSYRFLEWVHVTRLRAESGKFLMTNHESIITMDISTSQQKMP